MSENRLSSRVVRRILEEQGDHPEEHEPLPATAERQFTAQAFNLHVDWLDGRRSEGFAWAHYLGYRWRDESSHETLTLVFGPRAIEITGLNLHALLPRIRDGQLNGIRELPSAQRKELESVNPDNLAIIERVRTYPDFEEVLKEIKGEADEHPTRHARHA